MDAGQGGHFADVPGNYGERLFARAVASDQADLEALLERAAQHGMPGVVIDQDVTVPAEAASGRVIAELAAELDRVCGRRDALAGEIEEAPVTRQSGTSLAGEIRSRCGNHRLKNAMLRTGQPGQPARPAPGLPRAA